VATLIGYSPTRHQNEPVLLDVGTDHRAGFGGKPGFLSSRAPLVRKLARCMGVSVVTTVVSLTTLVAATAGLGMAAWVANVLATSVATVPSYHLNRRWTWGRRGESDLWREVAPFWALAFAGLVLSTVAVALTAGWLEGMHLRSGVLATGALLAAQLSAFGLLWVVQFVLLDRVLFAEG